MPLLQSLRRWIKPGNHAPLSNAAIDLTRSKAELVVENAFLRQQLIVLHRQVKRPMLKQRERVLLVLLAGLDNRSSGLSMPEMVPVATRV